MNPPKSILPSVVLVVFALALSACESGPRAESHVSPGAELGSYPLIYLMPETPWMANHSIVGLLTQELERRGYAVKLEFQPEESRSNSLILKLDYVGEKKEPDTGSTTKLRYLRFRLRDFAKGDLASVDYSGSTVDLIGQKELVRRAADDLFGPR